jgi:hypothetical protein
MRHRIATPGMRADIDPDRTVIAANPTLHTTRGVWYYLSRRENRMFIRITLEKCQESHM